MEKRREKEGQIKEKEKVDIKKEGKKGRKEFSEKN
jgi:hypothetical protein